VFVLLSLDFSKIENRLISCDIILMWSYIFQIKVLLNLTIPWSVVRAKHCLAGAVVFLLAVFIANISACDLKIISQ
jgi:hypothetical protein